MQTTFVGLDFETVEKSWKIQIVAAGLIFWNN
jgi:hypothetical protein